ncbi:MAG: tetratricopeptide repeat protein [Cyanobacteria bacterium TGS_CYA1]|nr:tetratricopeptide repeat protein [Cyanobacteria bacterium TGS_CYA1]
MKSKRFIISLLLANATVIGIGTQYGFAYNDRASKLQDQARDEAEKKNFARAESLYLQAAAEGEKNGFQYRANAIEELAQLYLDNKDYAKAEKMFLKALIIGQKEWAPSKSFDYEFENCAALSKLYRSQNNYSKASAIMTQAVSHLANPQYMCNDDRFDLASELIELSRWLTENKKANEAEVLCRQALRILNSGEDVKFHQKQIAFGRHQLAKCLIATKKYQEADELLSQVLAYRKTDFDILDWQIAGPSFDKLATLKGLAKQKEANALALNLNKYWPQSAFVPCSKKDKQLWEDTIIGADKLSSMDYSDETRVPRALEIAKKFGDKDIRFAINNALLARVKLNKDYKQVKPVSELAIESIEKVLGAKNPAAAAFLEHWGKSLENTSTMTSAPFTMYTEALNIRLSSAKAGDHDAFDGAWQIGNCCKSLFARSSGEDVLSMYDKVCKILVLSGGLKSVKTLNALNDQIAMLEYKNRFTIKPQDKSNIEALYKRLIDAQSKLYGASSEEFAETKSNYAAFLKSHVSY